MIVAIDPGPVKSARVIMDKYGHIIDADIIDNHSMIKCLSSYEENCNLFIEMIASYGMAVGQETFETCVWIGRFIQAWSGSDPIRYTRNEIKNHICHSSRANDSNIRQALIDRYGPPGTKKNPGPTYGITADMWAALAVATTAYDLNKNKWN